jgi:PTH2 family peptidyl-tRNA hydrolase
MSEWKYKMAIVVRTDLGMGKGKIAAQVAHAAVSLAWDVMDGETNKKVSEWFWEGQKKIVLKVDSLAELQRLSDECVKAGIRHTIIVDAGLTQIDPNTNTVLGIGPDTNEKIDSITKGLKLL